MKDLYDINQDDVRKVLYGDYLLMFGLYDTYRLLHDANISDLELRMKATGKYAAFSLAMDIIGVQPMQGPIGQIHTMRLRYGENTKSRREERLGRG